MAFRAARLGLAWSSLVPWLRFAQDPTGALVQSILIGAVVGIGVGVIMMIVGYLVWMPSLEVAAQIQRMAEVIKYSNMYI